jgi:hypothetical protein
MTQQDLHRIDGLRQRIWTWADLFQRTPAAVIEHLLAWVDGQPEQWQFATDDVRGRLAWALDSVTLEAFPVRWIDEAWRREPERIEALIEAAHGIYDASRA